MKSSTASIAALLAVIFAAPSRAVAQTPCWVPPPSLVSWWTGDSNEKDLYGVNNPSAVSGVTLVAAKVENGFSFATGGHIDIPHSSSLANQEFTWDAWVKPEDPNVNNDQTGSIILQQGIDNYHVAVSLNWRADPDYRFAFYFGNVGTEVIYSKEKFPPGVFYLVAGTYDGSTFSLYVNGVLEGTYEESKTIDYSSEPWEIGSSGPISRSEGYPRTFNGIIDEVEAFKRALSQSEIVAIYERGNVGKCKDPVIVAPTSVRFAPQVVGTTSPAKTITVTNNRNATATLDGFTFTGTDSMDFEESSTTCGGTLAARKSCTVDVTFRPEATGARTAVLDVHAVGSPQTVTLNGTGVLSTEVILAPSSLDLYCVWTFVNGPPHWNCSPPQTVLLTNVGSETLYITGIVRDVYAPFRETNNCLANLAAGRSCSITVTAYPPRYFCRTGAYTGAVVVNDTGTDSPQTVAVTEHVQCPY